ncbi:uncharacterized protein LOC132036965 [Lycium ferocissimum]|uniref:uncharacterized protein LOC132036965 n=1 Tax=Lycium ferocissimum TaxID=112874 RepID=UPI002814E31C|nr:uncharacterized protein LOC132036965 [Lycium ferocissimum]XP_059283367.1 uncharacterized protein LOC132036965 [Lycium ferocissimum]XP_059283368.1 uncharacterized protein LOC132036965 [Lycium ferocissimum]
MVLGLNARTRNSTSVQVDYLIHIKEIKPWPPSQSLSTPRAVLIECQHGDKHSGSTNQVVPSFGRIEFNESFRLPVTLLRETSVKGGDGDTFQKNCVEFHLYEPRRDKTVKGQHLGTAIIDLADYGVVRESLRICPPINCKRTYRNSAQPLLFLKIQLGERSRVRPSLRDSLKREASMDRNGSLSRLLSKEYEEEAEFASYTDDDVSSHLSLTVSSSANGSNYGSPPQGEDRSEGAKSSPGQDEDVQDDKKRLVDIEKKQGTISPSRLHGSLSHSSTNLSSDLTWISKKIGSSSSIPQYSTSNVSDMTEDTQNTCMIIKHDKQVRCVEQIAASGETGSEISSWQSSEEGLVDAHPADTDSNFSDCEIEEHTINPSLNGLCDDARTAVPQNGSVEGENSKNHPQNGQHCRSHNGEQHQENEQVKETLENEGQCKKDESGSCYSEEHTIKHDLKETDEISAYRESSGANCSTPHNEILKHEMSVRSSPESNIDGLVVSYQLLVKDTPKGARGFSSSERKDQKVSPRDTTNILLESKIHKLEQRVKMLEGELRETAAIEVGLYSVVAEHGCSINKVHAPARRLSRFYACKENSVLKRGSAAKSAISGIYLVAKACGNDVARLTFWLSNSVMLRATITKFHEQQQLPPSAETMPEKAVVKDEKKKFSPLKWESYSNNDVSDDVCESLGNWEDPVTFIRALEKIEAWIFSRIIESIWWQTLIPHMQSGAATAICTGMGSEINSARSRTSKSVAEEHGNTSLDLWKKALKDALERICPVRAGGHECGCLHLLSKLIMEQCVARLDVAIFNAILRESADEMPSDPISDPISDAEVLPIPAGKASFGAGAQLKNAIGNWSRWLTDLVGSGDANLVDDENRVDNEDDGSEYDSSSEFFYLLNALSDLMLLPKDMLLSRTIRKEVCPTFGPIIIRRVLNVFVPDEFCPDPIHEVVLEALNSEDTFDGEEDSIMSYPCTAAPIAYKPPSAALVDGLLGDVSRHSKLRRSGSSVLKKSYTSDDELDQLDLNFIISKGIVTSPLVKSSRISEASGNGNAVRYQLLREVWINSE